MKHLFPNPTHTDEMSPFIASLCWLPRAETSQRAKEVDCNMGRRGFCVLLFVPGGRDVSVSSPPDFFVSKLERTWKMDAFSEEIEYPLN